MDTTRGDRRANDTYGFALTAHPGKSQGRPLKPSGSQPIRQTRPARPAFSLGPCPGTRPNLPPRPDATSRGPSMIFIPVNPPDVTPLPDSHRQSRVSRRRRRPERLVASASAPALPRLRESSRCLPAARSAATGKHTSLSLPLAQQSPSADARVAAAETNGRGVCGDRRRPRSQMTKPKARVRVTTALRPGRSGAGEGVGAGRRPAAVQIGDGGRCGPFFALYSCERFAAAPACVRARPVI
jgi:hypothetical protein